MRFSIDYNKGKWLMITIGKVTISFDIDRYIGLISAEIMIEYGKGSADRRHLLDSTTFTQRYLSMKYKGKRRIDPVKNFLERERIKKGGD